MLCHEDTDPAFARSSRKRDAVDDEASADEIVRHLLHSQPVAPSGVARYPMDSSSNPAHRLQLRVLFVVRTQVEHNTRSAGSQGATVSAATLNSAVLCSAGSHLTW